MEQENLFKKFYRKLVRIGVVKAMLLAAICGLAAVFGCAIVTIPFYLPVKTILLIVLGAFAGVFAFAVPILYFTLFKPTKRDMDREIDKLGLEERVITMHELEGSNSYLALCQREDAKKKLGSVKTSDLKYKISKTSLLALCIAFALSLSMTGISSLVSVKYAESLQNQQGEDPEVPEKDPEYVTIKYLAEEGMGHIEGQAEQVILKGSDAQSVLAVPEEGFIFVKWSDDYIYAERWDWNVLEDIEVEAIFIPQMEGGGNEGNPGDEGGSGGNSQPGGDEGSGGDDEGGEGGNGSGEENGGQGTGSGSEDGGDEGQENPGEGQTGGSEIEDPNGVAGTGGKSNDNTVIDGQTDYKTAIDENSEEDLENDDSIPDELKDLIKRYLENLRH